MHHTYLQVRVVEMEVPGELPISTEVSNAEEPPPEYASLALEESPQPELPRGDSVSSGTLEQGLQRSLTVEAPPSYRDIFGSKESTESVTVKKNKQWRRTQRPHTTSRRQRQLVPQSSGSNGFLSRICPQTLIISVAVIAAALPLAMIVVGSLNLKVCASVGVPLYLVVVGSCLCLEILIHTFTILTSIHTDSENINRSLRLCDCFAFFILIWILIGSNWIFKLSIKRDHPCSDEASSGELPSEAATTPLDCVDCSEGVYAFAVAIVSLQYVVVCLVLVVCCCVAVKRKPN